MIFQECYRRWLLPSSLSGLALLAAVVNAAPLAVAALIAWALGSYAILLRSDGDLSRSANRVTVSRVILAAAALACGFFPQAAILQPLLFALAIGSDFLDGWLARRSGETTSGAVLDMEADQLLVLLMAVATLQSNPYGALVLLLPAYKYLFTVLHRALRLPADNPKPVAGDNRRAKCIYLLVLAALYSALPAMPMPGLSATLLALALPALAASFATDTRYQWLHARPSAL